MEELHRGGGVAVRRVGHRRHDRGVASFVFVRSANVRLLLLRPKVFFEKRTRFYLGVGSPLLLFIPALLYSLRSSLRLRRLVGEKEASLEKHTSTRRFQSTAIKFMYDMHQVHVH